MLFLAKATKPHRFRLSAVRCRTLWAVDCIITAPSTQLSAATWDVITATDSGSLANNRPVRVTQFYWQDKVPQEMWFHRQRTMWLWRNPDNVTHRQLLSIDQVWRRSTGLTWSRWGCRRLADNIWLLAHNNNN